jgi:hypothetical protein
MIKFIFNIAFIFIALFLIITWLKFEEPPLPKVSKKIQQLVDAKGICRHLDRCVILYISPSCKNCRESTAAIKTLQSRLKKYKSVGMAVVIGQDHSSALKSLGSKINKPYLLDPAPESEIAVDLDLEELPYFIVLNKQREITDRVSAKFGPEHAKEDKIDLFIQKYLGVRYRDEQDVTNRH